MARLNITLTRFFGLSLAIHAALFCYFILKQKLAWKTRAEPPAIPVSLLPPGERVLLPAAPPAATKNLKPPAIVAKKDSPIAKRKELRAQANQAQERTRSATAEKTAVAIEKSSLAERNRDEQVAGLPVPTSAETQRELPIEKSVVAERRLPTVKELLPPLTYSSEGGRSSAPVSLNTHDPAYMNYFNRIKQAINQKWEYPELAKRYGLQGTLFLEFAIGANGQLEHLRLVRSSGSQLLDDEALRAIKAAAPFAPIPSWIKNNPLPISATMEYHDSRLNYPSTR
ncbi:MAG: TonB family protein [Candidatus Binatia bacterium]